MLGAGGAEHVGALAVEQDRRAQVHGELHVDEFGLVLVDLGAYAHACVVDEHVEPPVALAVPADNFAHGFLVGQVRGDGLHLEPALAQLGGRALERLGLARGDRQAVALLPERLRERESDPARGSGDECGAFWHAAHLIA